MIYVLGLGAAGNKAAIRAIEVDAIDKGYVTLINSTEKDIPEEYKKNAVIIGNNLKGCGKERDISKSAIVSYLREHDTFSNIPEDVDRVVIVTATEGGTGSGSTPILAKYIRDVIGINTSIFAFTGFENDARGMKNTINFMKEIDPETTIQIISNKKFLTEANSNFIKAQELANHEFCKRLVIMSGVVLQESDQNIDDTDLHKLIDAPGLLDITYTDIESPLKNTESFNKFCSTMVDESKSVDFTPTASRIGVIFNGKDSTKDIIDYSYSVFKSKYGEPFEVYSHLQENTVFQKEFIACIASGMKLPIEALQKTYDDYLKTTSKISKDRDSFFDTIGELKDPEEDKVFDMKRRRVKSDKDFFFKDLD